ncbi:MAG: rRNA maturation RNase YbeY [Spirosomataceae bacterium]
MTLIHYFFEDISYKIVRPIKTKRWIRSLVNAEGFELNSINFIFCSDEYLLQINREYLNHDYYTDIITFDNSESDREIEGDIFISLDRVFENARSESIQEEEELRRVLAHGVLHLCGYDDHTDEEKSQMRSKENYYLQQFNKVVPRGTKLK